jgi:2-amino-4-hydroxy-6-hydroxymethyldihydropteridine diphosphokinase
VGGPADQPRYINAAATIQTALEPMELLHFFQDIEQQLGRVRRERWGARTIDIDILLYGNEIIVLPDLVIPHSEMLRRRFVLEPAKDVAPDWVVPTTRLTIIQHFLQIK